MNLQSPRFGKVLGKEAINLTKQGLLSLDNQYPQSVMCFYLFPTPYSLFPTYHQVGSLNMLIVSCSFPAGTELMQARMISPSLTSTVQA